MQFLNHNGVSAYPLVIVEKHSNEINFRKVVVNKLINDPHRRHQCIKALNHKINCGGINGGIIIVLYDHIADPKSLWLVDKYFNEILLVRGDNKTISPKNTRHVEACRVPLYIHKLITRSKEDE